MVAQTSRGLAEDMARVARLLEQEVGLTEVWGAIVRLAVDEIDGVNHAGITVVRRNLPATPASSSELPVRVDGLQYELREGPCLTAIAEQDTFRSGDLGAETERLPSFGPAVAERFDVHSMVSYRLFVQDDDLGALNFYSHERDAFSDELVAKGAVFAAHASLAASHVKEHERAENLARSLDSNRRIGAAMGILMAHLHVTEDEAFDLLRQSSQHGNRKLRDVAEDVLHTGSLPEERRPSPRNGHPT